MKVSWEALKSFYNSREVDMIMIEEESHYHLFVDDTLIQLECIIDKNPSETTSLDEFEGTYKSKCNPSKYNKDEMISWGKFHEHIDSSQYNSQTPKIIDIKFPDDTGIAYYNFFGSWVHVEDYGSDDYAIFQLIDIDNILGLGANTVLKEYCELWAKNIAKTVAPIYDPKKSAGKVKAGLYARIIFVPTDATKTDVKFWGKLVSTVNT